MNIRNVSSKKGFTLMELLVVITLLALTGAGFLVQAIHARNISNLDVAKNMLVGALNEAQAKGRGGMRVPDPFVEEKFDAGFGVYVEKEDNTKIISYEGDPEAGEIGRIYRSGESAAQTTALPDGVIFSDIKGKTDSGWGNDLERVSMHFKRGTNKGVFLSDGTDEYVGVCLVLKTDVQGNPLYRYVYVWNTGLVYASTEACS